jgi:hypothetical protein
MSNEPPHSEAEIVELIRSIDVRAPQELHTHVQELVAASSPKGERAPAVSGRRPTVRLGLFAGVPALAAAVIAILVVSLAGGGSSGSPLTLEKAVALTLRPPTMAAPDENPKDGTQLMVSVDGVAFPYWEQSFGFRATGERMDQVDGRRVTTVFYADDQHNWVGYAIIGGTPPPPVNGGTVIVRDGTAYHLTSSYGARVVTWLRGGRQCVVAGHGVGDGTLLALASWHAVDTTLAS